MKYLSERVLPGKDSRFESMVGAGGLYVADRDANPSDIRRELVESSVRALEVQSTDLTWLDQLPLEFLIVNAPSVEAGQLATLASLRGLHLDSWSGDLELAWFPDLEWFGATEIGPTQVNDLLEKGHGRLKELSIGRFTGTDLAGLTGFPGLLNLSITDSRALASLSGLVDLANLRVLELALCPRLRNLAGLESAKNLEVLILDTCNGLDDLAPLRGATHLKLLEIEMRKPPSLGPLVGHPGMRGIWLVGGKRPVEEVEALLDSPSLWMVNAARSSWIRADQGWEHIEDVYAMTPDQTALYEQAVEELRAIRA